MLVTHETPVGGNVFADIGFSKEEAETLKICSSLMMAIEDVIDERQLSVAQAAKQFGVLQTRMRQLARGRIGGLKIDLLVRMLTHAGMQVEVRVKSAT